MHQGGLCLPLQALCNWGSMPLRVFASVESILDIMPYCIEPTRSCRNLDTMRQLVSHVASAREPASSLNPQHVASLKLVAGPDFSMGLRFL